MSLRLFKALSAAAVAALLAACGGGDDAPAVNVAWASPAYIVPAGSASKTIALSNCNDGLQTATLVVTSDGDMILRGAPSGTTTISELRRINYASATYRYVDGRNAENGPRAYVQLRDGKDNMYAETYGDGYFYSYKVGVTPSTYGCSLAGGTTSFALTSLPSSARVASLMTSGITGIDATSVQFGTFTGGVATWDNLEGGSAPPPTDDQAIRFISLNVNTGAIGTSATATGTFATTAITVPTTPTSTYAFFSEEISEGVKSFNFEVARSVGGNLEVYFRRIGNLLKVFPEVSYSQPE
jgi:hypothetical protein